MTRVQFYHNAENPGALACELVARAWASGRRVAVRAADAPGARQLDQLLWTLDPQSFIPHVLADNALASETPVVIGHAEHPADWPHHEVLINLAADVPPDYAHFKMLVEIVGQSEQAKQPARSRWKHYKQLNLPLQAFDAVSREAL